jgi:tetratricopeptide (TPR) repeat protein
VHRILPLPILAQSLVDSGQLDEAAKVIEESLRFFTECGSPYRQAVMTRIEGQRRVSAGDAAQAEPTFSRAVEMLEPLETRIELARALYERGRAHRMLGNRDAAQDDFRRAQELFARCGAEPERTRAAEG